MTAVERIRVVSTSVLVLAAAGSCVTAAEPPPAPPAGSGSVESPAQPPAAGGIWQSAVGNGFLGSAQDLTLEAGAVGGAAIFGSKQHHDLALGSLSYGHMLSGLWGDGHWYRGNLELRAELFGGEQFSPRNEWIVGLTPHLRYSFATRSRLVPFADMGAGVTLTGIRGPDLGGVFEFNLQPGGGLHWFLKSDLALTAEVHFLHLSSAGISSPNLGVNGFLGTVGLSRFF
jgi:hypothetical protein